MQLRCRAPRAVQRFALVRQGGNDGPRVLQFLSPVGPEALFELRDVSVADSGNYTCLYVNPVSPFKGSKPSAPLELLVDGEARSAGARAGRALLSDPRVCEGTERPFPSEDL